MAETAPSVSAPPNEAPLLASLPALPPLGGAPPVPGPASATSTPIAKGRGRGGAGKGAARKADDAPDGEPKPKRSRKRPADGTGPGKNWRKGLKGGFGTAGDATDGSVAGTPGAATPSAAGAHFAPASSPAPSRGSVAATAAVSSAIAPPPKMGNQFVAVQTLHLGTPRPRKWVKSRMAFKRIDGKTNMLPTWQGDSYSSFATAIGSAEVDELASPPPAPPSNLAAATAAFSHRDSPPAPAEASTSAASYPAIPQARPIPNAPALPPLPALSATARGLGSGAQGVQLQDAPAETKTEVNAQAAGLAGEQGGGPAGVDFVPGAI